MSLKNDAWAFFRIFADCHRRVPFVGVDMHKKLKERIAWLEDGTTTSFRNRAQSLGQAFSISRFDETGDCEIADAWPLIYPTNLPCMCPQAIQTIYIVQSEHKTQSVYVFLNFVTIVA